MRNCLYIAMEGSPHHLDDQFKALASPVRRRLLRLVRDEERSVNQLAQSLGASQPATSQHLAVLRDAGLVSVRSHGRSRLYRADHVQLEAASRFFDDYWSNALDRLAEAAESAAARRRSAS